MLPSEQEIYRAGAGIRAAKGSEANAAIAESLTALKWRYGLTGEGWDDYATALASARAQIALSPMEWPSEKQSALWHDIAVFRTFDPAERLTKIRVPVLLMFGANDLEVPARRAEEMWRAALAASGNRDGTVIEIPDAGHSLFQRTARNAIASDVRDGIASWLAAHRLR